MTLDERICLLEQAIRVHYEAMATDPVGVMRSVTINGRTVEYQNAEDMQKHLNALEANLANLKRQKDGTPRFGRSVGVFTRQ